MLEEMEGFETKLEKVDQVKIIVGRRRGKQRRRGREERPTSRGHVVGNEIRSLWPGRREILGWSGDVDHLGRGPVVSCKN
eukprot:764783-Hanusia_phi.AAC.10